MFLARERGWIGVDIGTHTVKLAQVERQGSRIALAEAVVVQRAEPWNDNGGLAGTVCESEEELIAARMLGERFMGRKAAAVPPMAICQLKSMQVPEGALAERRQAVAHELAKTPVPGGHTREFDFWPIDSALENATIVRENVSVLSMATDWTVRLAADHNRARLTCCSLDGLPLALGRAVRMCEHADRTQPIAVLDWGFTRATFCIVLDGRPLFVRCLRDCEFGVVMRALRSSLSLTWDEARRVASEFAVGSQRTAPDKGDLQVLVREVVAPAINQLVVELERTMVYLQTHRSKLVPQQMWLFGGGAAVRGIEAWLEPRLKVKTRCWSLGEETFRSDSAGVSPMAMLGPAMALSALAWEGV